MSSAHPKPATAARTAKRGAHAAVRIIGGLWKRTPITIVDADGLRPTPDRVRETLFNWLVHQHGGTLDGLAVLDLFAGSGALGFEAASRGAASVVLVETAPRARAALVAVKARLAAEQVEIDAADAREVLRRYAANGVRFDVVFLDPPYREGWIERVLAPAAGVLATGGLMYVECEKWLDEAICATAGLDVLRKDKAGRVFYHLLRQKADHAPGEANSC